MTEFIGSRISLISKRDIRYVGTLNEINSENHSVALEQVVCFGTEGRHLDDEVPPSDNVYEYICFRGSDVKDLRIEEPPKENKPPKPPQIPDDPAILGSARRPNPSSTQQGQQAPSQPQPQQPQSQHPPQSRSNQQNQPRQGPPPPQFQPPQFPYFYSPPPYQRFGPQGYPPGPGFPEMSYGAPRGWYPPPGHGFPPHMPAGQFQQNQMSIGPPGPQQNQKPLQPQPTAPIETAPAEESGSTLRVQSPKPAATVKLPSSSTTPVPLAVAQQAPQPPTESKPDVAAALAPSAPTRGQSAAATTKLTPTGPKSGRIIPAVPLPSPNVKTSMTTNGLPKLSNGNTPKPATTQPPLEPIATKPTPPMTQSIEEATRDARAAVAAAMAKLPPAPGQKKQADSQGAMDNLTKKVNEMRTNDNIRTSRQPGTGGYAAGHRGGGRGGYRGARAHAEQQGKKVEVPMTDYDFASANAKFNKQDLVKEVIASGSPIGSPIDAPMTNGSSILDINEGANANESAGNIPTTMGYNRKSSFFDNISSETKDRTEDGGNRLGGREFRSEERQKNVETFGQGSVDNGYRGGFGRGRARSRGYARGNRGGYGVRGGTRGARGGRGTIATEG